MLADLLRPSPPIKTRQIKRVKLEQLYPHIDFKKKKLIDAELNALYEYRNDPCERKEREYYESQTICEKYFKYRTKSFIKMKPGEVTYYKNIEKIERKRNKHLSNQIKKILYL